jgi:hypothetical protein
VHAPAGGTTCGSELQIQNTDHVSSEGNLHTPQIMEMYTSMIICVNMQTFVKKKKNVFRLYSRETKMSYSLSIFFIPGMMPLAGAFLFLFVRWIISLYFSISLTFFFFAKPISLTLVAHSPGGGAYTPPWSARTSRRTPGVVYGPAQFPLSLFLVLLFSFSKSEHY